MCSMKRSIFPSGTADKFVVRLPGGMRDHIAEVARQHRRSMNSEIISRLEQSLLRDGTLDALREAEGGSAQLLPHESELLARFRQLPRHQQNALVTLIAQDAVQEAG